MLPRTGDETKIEEPVVHVQGFSNRFQSIGSFLQAKANNSNRFRSGLKRFSSKESKILKQLDVVNTL